MMVVSPELKIPGEGKEACGKSYTDFMNRAAILSYKQSDPEVKIWESTAIVYYEYQMAWEMNGKKYDEPGISFH